MSNSGSITRLHGSNSSANPQPADAQGSGGQASALNTLSGAHPASAGGNAASLHDANGAASPQHTGAGAKTTPGSSEAVAQLASDQQTHGQTGSDFLGTRQRHTQQQHTDDKKAEQQREQVKAANLAQEIALRTTGLRA